MNFNLHLNGLAFQQYNNDTCTHHESEIDSQPVCTINYLRPAAEKNCDNFNEENTLNDIRLTNHRKMKNDKET